MPNSDVLSARDDWRSGRIAAESTRIKQRYGSRLQWWVKFGLSLTVITSIPVLIFRDPDLLLLPVGMFVFLVGCPAFVYFLRKFSSYRQHRKYGNSHFVFDPPAEVGRRLEGTIEASIPMSGHPADGFEVTVACLSHRIKTDSDGKRVRRTSTQWEATQTVDGVSNPSGNGLTIPIFVDLPSDQSSSSVRDGEGIDWQVTVHAKMPGLSYHADFLIPVAKELSDQTARNERLRRIAR